MISQEKDLLTKILYNREAVFVWDFIEMEKVKKEMALAQKIWTIKHKVWQIPDF